MTAEPLDDGRLTWTHVRTETIERFKGQAPRAEDEARVIDHFERAPVSVLAAIDQVAEALAAGKVTWAWSALAGRLDRQGQAVRDAVVDTGSSHQTRLARAEQWVRAAGLYFDRWGEVDDELFVAGIGGGLRAPLRLERSEATERHMRELWERERPRGVAAEAEAEERAARFVEQRGGVVRVGSVPVSVAELADPEPVVFTSETKEAAGE